MHQVENTNPAPDQVDQVPVRGGRASGLLRRTFIIALVLVSGGLITSSAVELFFRYRESVEAIWSLQRELARGAAFEIQQFVRDIEHTLWAATQTPDIVAAGLTEAERFQLDKLLKVTPAITTAVALDAPGALAQGVTLADGLSRKIYRTTPKMRPLCAPVGGQRSSARCTSGRRPSICAPGCPHRPFPGDVIGVLSAEVRLTYIREVIAQVAVGQAGHYAYVISGEGDLAIADHDLSLVLQKRHLKHLRRVQMALDATPGPFVAQPNLAGQQGLGGVCAHSQPGMGRARRTTGQRGLRAPVRLHTAHRPPPPFWPRHSGPGEFFD